MTTRRIILVILGICVIFSLGYIIGHSSQNRIDAGGTYAYYNRGLGKDGFGKVVSATEKRLTVTEYDFDTDRDVRRAYDLQPQTYLGNFKSIKDLKEGDDVVFTYLEKTDGRRIISIIVKEPYDDDDEEYETPKEESSGTKI